MLIKFNAHAKLTYVFVQMPMFNCSRNHQPLCKIIYKFWNLEVTYRNGVFIWTTTG